jgi:hypothetical protein
MTEAFHRRYLTLVDEIERRFPVSCWRRGDLEVWPVARMELYLDMYWANAGRPRPQPRPFPLRSLARIARPWRNAWRSRRDLAHFVARPKPAYAMFLGDGVSLDFVDGSWRDRFSEPLIAALEKRGLGSFLIQSGFDRLPWYRPTFAANLIAGRGYQPNNGAGIPVELPAREEVVEFLECNGVRSASLDPECLARTANVVAATATEFERVMRIVKPTLAFVVTYYANLGHSFLLACRRQGILSIDLQHCAQEGAHKAYGWSVIPKTGYASLPAIFWNWSETDAAAIRKWTSRLEHPWHRSLYGGHTQLASFLNDVDSSATASWDRKFESIGAGTVFEREILVALQPIAGYRAQWEALAEVVKTAPASWRWWIRRHPASSPLQDEEYMSLLALRMANVVVKEASLLPLPALLRHMSILVSLASGTAAEATVFGVPTYFLVDDAHAQFAELIDRGLAEVVQVGALAEVIARTPKSPVRPSLGRAPGINDTLDELSRIAGDYKKLCRGSGRIS